MSTNKTENYSLHAWVAGDDFLREEINENFAALDQVMERKTGIVVGSYVGDGTALRHIELGRKPLAVLVELADGVRQNLNNMINGGMALQNVSLAGSAMVLNNTGFTLSTANQYSLLNSKGQVRIYLAAVEDE